MLGLDRRLTSNAKNSAILELVGYCVLDFAVRLVVHRSYGWEYGVSETSTSE
jgi:hypothetical protein